MISRPEPNEYRSFYKDYIARVDGEVMNTLVTQGQQLYAFIQQLSPEQADFRYAENKWCVREVIGHLIDTERIMSYRALCISRGETASLPGYDQDAYVEQANFGQRDLQNMASEYDAVRNATIAMFNGFSDEQLLQTGTANDVPFSVRAFAYVIAGHERWHLDLLEERYKIEIPA